MTIFYYMIGVSLSSTNLNIFPRLQAARIAAKNLKDRLDEIEKTMEKPPTWAELVKYAYSKDVDLTERYA